MKLQQDGHPSVSSKPNDKNKRRPRDMPADRVQNWKRFSEHMEAYIRDRIGEKYGFGDVGDAEKGAVDLMRITRPDVCIWNILRYALRNWKGKGGSTIWRRLPITRNWRGRWGKKNFKFQRKLRLHAQEKWPLRRATYCRGPFSCRRPLILRVRSVIGEKT